MNAISLIAHYERVVDAPDAIARLRRFILDLAVRGKIVPQDSTDEPAGDFLRRIAALNKSRAGPSRNKGFATRMVTPPPARDPTDGIPVGWAWTRVGACSTVVMGQSPPGDTYNTAGEGVPLINGPVEFTAGPFGTTVVNQYTTAPTNFCEKGDLLICVRGSTTGRTNIAGFRACIGRGVAAIQPDFDDAFIRLFIWSMRDRIIGMGRGIAFPSISRKQVEDLALPLPPLSEQHRIVAKVNELMALCDRLEAARVEQEARRDRLAIATLARLNSLDLDTIHSDARFAIFTLPALTARPHQIKNLRQTILNLAVRGKLVPQNLNDESAPELLKWIAIEKNRLDEEGTLKKDKAVWDGLPSERPHEIPVNWVWTCLQDIFEISRGGSPRPAGDPRYFGGPIPWITVREITKDGEKYLVGTESGLTEEGATRSRFIAPGDLLLTNSGATLGVPKISSIRACMNDGVAVLRRFHTVEVNDYAYLYLQSQTGAFRNVNQGMGQPNLNTTIIASWPFPLPPAAEQRRIVSRVDELMGLCDRLEASLASRDGARSRLLDALLDEALPPDHTPTLDRPIKTSARV
jgi:type I restriction enzyme, S subunit